MRPVFVLLLILVASPSRAQQPRMPASDRIRLAEAFSLSEDVQDQVWPGWSDAPFALLLVTPESEFLIRHPEPSDDFASIGYDSLLASEVYVRPRTYSPELLATFPAVGGVPTVVVGQPENTRLSSTFWVVTVLHEHFHQLQNSRPNYWEAIQALDLSGGDETGMWMLNYPFPYESAVVAELFGAYCDALRNAFEAIGGSSSLDEYRDLVMARSDLAKRLSERDRRYLSFQLWQEGVARYVEMQTARFADLAHTSSRAFRELGDFVPYGDVADSLLIRLNRDLAEVDLSESKRVAFYSIGAAEAFLLDSIRPGWKPRYFGDMFRIERYYDPLPFR